MYLLVEEQSQESCIFPDMTTQENWVVSDKTEQTQQV
jgi:hypothetical protein